MAGANISTEMKSVSDLFDRNPLNTDDSLIESQVNNKNSSKSAKSYKSKNSQQFKFLREEQSVKKLYFLNESSDAFAYQTESNKNKSNQTGNQDLYRSNRLKGVDNAKFTVQTNPSFIQPTVYFSNLTQDNKNFKKNPVDSVDTNFLHPGYSTNHESIYRTTRVKPVKEEKPTTPHHHIAKKQK